MSDGVKYLARGGPLDGQPVDAPPGVLAHVADAVADAFGVARNPAGMKVTSGGWVYEFSPDEPEVLIGRPMTAEELSFSEAFAEALQEIGREDEQRARMGELSPTVVAALRSAHALLTGNECVSGRRDDVVIFVARGETAAAWTKALEALGAEHGCTPEDIPDRFWEQG